VSCGIGGESAPVSYYLLGGLVAPEGSAATRTVGLLPPQVAPYLSREEIVTRAGPNSVTLADFDRWATPLPEGIAEMVAANLTFLGAGRVDRVMDAGPSEFDRRVLVEILRLDGSLGGEVVLAARYTIVAGDHWQVLAEGVRSWKETASGDSYAAYVDAMGRLLLTMCREIVGVLG
jgi:hypothetical protein